MKNITYNNKNYLGIKEGVVPPAPQYLWINSEDNRLYKFGNSGWEPIRDEVLKGFTAEQIEDILNSIENKVDKVDGKGLSTNDYTNEEKEQVAKNTSDIAKNTEKIAEQGVMLAKHGEDIAKNAEEIGRKAEQNGRYDKLTSGFAANIVGDGSATEEVIGFRPTAGEERNVANTTYIDGERNEAARMTSIKGNSVVYSQLLRCALDQANVGKNGWWVRGLKYQGVTASIDGTTIRYDVIPEPGTSQQISQYVGELVVGHTYLLTFGYNNNGVVNDKYNRPWIVLFSNDVNGNITEDLMAAQNIPNSGTATVFYTIKTSGLRYVILKQPYVEIDPVTPTIMEWSDIRLFDLTQMFGAGNEPTTIEEFYQRMPVGVDINAYNEGELIDGHYSALRSTAFNQYNGRYAKVLAGVTYHVTGDIASIGFSTEEGGTTENITLDNGKYTPTQNGYIYASGDNICIHLCWSEYAHMEDMYEEYKPFVRDLSWIKKYFPNGMRSAGNVRDEIRYNATEERWEAVQRVDRVAGEMANYALATPIVTPIEEAINLDYDCSDYGTEELISEGASAPLVADVVYAPNALSTLKQVPDILRRLAVLEAKAVENTNVTIEE